MDMRHLVGVLLAVVMAAAVFFVASWGYLKLLTSPARGGALPGTVSLIHNHAVLEGFGALLAVGLLAGILIALPMISPLAAGLPGLALLAWTGLYLFNVRRAVRYVPLKTHSYGAGFEAMLIDGVLALVGAAMIIPLFVPSRWRSRPAVSETAPYEAPNEAPATTYPDLGDPGATQAMTAGGFVPGWAETRPQPQTDPGRSQAPWGPAEPGDSAGQGGTADHG
jgi:hypothetical protein